MDAKLKGLVWIVAAIAVTVLAAAGLPYFAKHIPWSAERWLARTVGGSSFERPCEGRTHPESKVLFQQLVKRIYPIYPEDRELPLTVEVIPGKTVNAFATLGARIYVFDGLIKQAESAEELAGVLAHEIEHVRNRHIIQGVAVNLVTVGALSVILSGDHQIGAQVAQLLLNLKFSRQQEYEADEMGLRRLQKARVDSAGIQRFFARAEKMSSPPQIFSNHPANQFRAQLAARFQGYSSDPIMDPKQWQVLQTICQ